MAKERGKSRPLMPMILIGVGALLLLGGALMALNNLAPAPVSIDDPVPAQSEAGIENTEIRIPFPDVPRVSLVNAHAAYEAKTALFVDTRGEVFYSQGHIPGAVVITEENYQQHWDALQAAERVIPYCT